MSSIPRFPSPPPTYDAHSTPQFAASTSTLKPYLVLPHLLSLTWLAYPILSILFVAFRLQISLASSQDAVASAKDGLLASCKAAERAATSTASIPRYMAAATNEQFVDAVNGTLRAARATLVLALTIMEAIINFIIDIYRSTFLCFLELIVRGALAILIGAVEEFGKAVSAVANGLRTTLQNQIQSANSVIQSAINALNKINPFSDITVPQIPIPDLSGLENVQLPTDFQDALTRLNASLPTVAQLKDKVEGVIDTPFELLKKDINDTFTGITFNSSVMPVPQQNSVRFCSDLDLSVVDNLGRDLIRIAKIGVIVLIVLALLLIALNCLLEWYKWKCLTRHLEYTRQAWVSDPTLYHSSPPPATSAPRVTLSDHNLLMLQGNMSHPLLTRIANNMATRLRLSQTQHTHLQWFFHYIFHPPALACFLIGFIGILSIQVQLLAIGVIETKYSNAAASTTSDFSHTIATSINQSMYAQSSAYATDVNSRVDSIQSTVNDGLFGWVNVTTTELNTTIVNFYAGVENVVQTVFNGTLLETPANEFLRCILGSKVDAIENALTFLNQNLRIDLPRMNDSALVLSEASINEAARPIALAAIGGSEDGNPDSDNRGIFGKLINAYADGLRKERIMFAIFLILWGVVVLMALGVIFWHSYGRDLLERRGRRRWQREQRSGFEGIVVPFRSAGNEKGVAELPPPSPILSPRPPGVFSPSLKSSSPAHLQNKDKDPEKSWDSFFGDVGRESKFSGMVSSFASRTRARTISAPKKLMAISKKAVNTTQPGTSENGRGASFASRIRSFGGFLSRSPQSSVTQQSSPTRSRHRPNLTISVDRASSIKPEGVNIETAEKETAPPKSAWSVSPTTPPEQPATSPKPDHVTTPSVASIQLRPSLPWTRNVVSPPPLPLRVMNPSARSSSNGSVASQQSDGLRPRHNVNVPSDVTATSLQDVFGSAQPTPMSPQFAPPLHHGYGRSGIDSRYPPIEPRGLMPPVDKHRRSLSVPIIVTPVNEQNPFSDATPVTRLLATTHAHKSSSVNPFEVSNPFEGATPSPASEFVHNPFDRSPVPSVNPFITPFDDEHRVTISHAKAANIRKSIPTNPYGAVAI